MKRRPQHSKPVSREYRKALAVMRQVFSAPPTDDPRAALDAALEKALAKR